jgi:glutamine amidotransferase
MKVVMADLGVGNLLSLERALTRAGADVEVVADPSSLVDARVLVIPGVASFPAASSAVASVRGPLGDRLMAGVPTLGICAGLQLFYEGSEEGPGRGLGLLPGKVRRLEGPKVPHMGWERVSVKPAPIFRGLEAPFFYFAHSYAPPEDSPGVVGRVEGVGGFPCAVRRGNTFGVQFHPEKSHVDGAAVLRNFLEFAEGVA